MEDNVKCYRSHNIKVDCDLNFVDSISLKITLNQLKEIQIPNKIIFGLIKELEGVYNDREN